jgi:hypothetical protein
MLNDAIFSASAASIKPTGNVSTMKQCKALIIFGLRAQFTIFVRLPMKSTKGLDDTNAIGSKLWTEEIKGMHLLS